MYVRTNTRQQPWQAEERRKALEEAGCCTYTLLYFSNGEINSIFCLCCGRESINPNDIAQRYCGYCHTFHSDWSVDQWEAHADANQAPNDPFA